MISISKSKFVVLGFVMVAVLLIPVNDAFADVPSPITDITVGHPSGTIIEWDMDYNSLCADYGMCYSGFHMMTIQVISLSSNGFIHYPVSLPESGAEFGGHELIKEGTYDYKLKLNTTNYPDGNYKLDINFQYQPGSTISGSSNFIIASPSITPSLTIDSLSTYKEGSNLMYVINGDTPISNNIEVKVITPNGVTNQVHNFGTATPIYQSGGAILNPFNADNWKVQICVAEYDVCIEESFTINSIVEDTPADTTPPVFGSLEYRDESYDVNGAVLVDEYPITGSGDYISWTLTATDNVGVVSGPTCNPPSTTTSSTKFPVGDTTVTCTASDAAGNVVTATFTVQVWPCCDGIDPNGTDTTPTGTTVPTPTLSAYLNSTSPTGRTISVTDVGLEFDDGSDRLTVLINIDGHTNDQQATHKGFHVMYAQDWQMGIPEDWDYTLDNFTWQESGHIAIYTSYSQDWQMSIPEDWESGTYNITWDLHQPTGIVSSGSTSITVPALLSTDTTPPVITVPSDQTFTTTDPAGYVYDFSVSATDNVAIDTTGTSNAGPGIFCVDWIPNPTPPGTLFPVGAGDSNHVVCSATDTSGNYGQATFIVTVIYEAAADTTPPVLTVPANQILYVENSSPVYDSLLQITYAEGGIVGDFTEFSWFSSLAAFDTITNSTGTYSQIIMPNCQVPVLTGPFSGFNYSITTVPIRSVSTDTGNGGSSGYGVNLAFPMGTTTLNCMATDMAGNVATDSFTITVAQEGVDTTPPVIYVPNNLTFTGSSVSSIPPLFVGNSGTGIGKGITTPEFASAGNVTAIDNVDGNIPVSCDTSIYSWQKWQQAFYFLGTNTITCSATDSSDNTGSASFTITVTDDTGNVPTSNPQSYTVLVNEMRSGNGATNWDQSLNTGCTSFNPQTCYTPSVITINVGDSVTWVHNDPTNNWYTLRGDFGGLVPVYSDNYVGTGGYSGGDGGCDGPGHLGYDMCGISGNDITSWTHTFDTVGTYNYHDWVYQNYPVRPEGVVNVVASGAPAPVTPTTPTPNTIITNDSEVAIVTVDESGFSQTCAESQGGPGCYTPVTATVEVGGVVTMTNTDPTGVHTFTSGTVDGFAPYPNGTFDSGVLMSGDSFAWTPQTDVDQPYYCMLHTWMVGEIIIGDVDVVEPEPIPELTDEEFNVTTAEKVSVGDLLKIDIIASHKTSIQIEILTTTGNSIHELTCSTTTEFICETYWSVPNNTLPGTYFIIANSTTSSDQTTFEIIQISENEITLDVDDTPPELEKVNNITVDATTSNGAIVNYNLPIATDNTGITVQAICNPTSGSFFQTGTTEVTCSGYDAAGNVGTTSFTVTVNSLIAAPVEITTDVSITIGKHVYNTDEAIFVTGIATPFTENNVSIQVEDSSDNVVLVEQITPESSGIYTGIIFPNFLWSTSGNYTMSATYGNSTANTSFGFEFIESVIDEYISPTGITLQTDTSMYAIGDTITIESALTDVGSGYEIGIFVEDPNGTLAYAQFLNTDDSGSISLSLKTQDNWISGEWEIYAEDGRGWEKSVTIDIIKPIPEITISPTVTTTESGNTITSYDAGDMAYFSTSLLSESTSDVLVTINVVDSDDTTLGVAFFKSIIGKGDSELVLGFKIPEDAADGAAKIYVNTYTDWIDQGGIVIGSELLSEVNIEGVIIEETVVEEVVEEIVLPENTIPRLSTVTDITQLASFTTGSVVSYSLPLATSGATTLDATCTPAPGSMFSIGSTQVTCTATNDFGNTGMTSFMVTINPILQTADQSLSVKVGKDLYNNLEPLFVTGSVGTVTGEPINLEVRDTQNNLISIEQVTPKESSVYSAVLTSNELWDNTGEYTIIAKYEGVIALDTFEFELVEVEEVIPEKIPTSLFIDTLDSAYVLGDVVGIGVNLVDAGAGESILLEIKDSQNDQVLIQSLNTDSDGIAVFLHQLDSSGEPGVYSVTAVSDEWSFSNSENFIAVAQIPDITIGDVVSTLQDGTEVDSFESGDMGYFQTPIISESVSDVLITVNIFDVENTPLGLAYFNSKVVDDTFDITLGLQIPQDAAPGLATVYINTYTDWVSEGGVPILEEQISFIEIVPFSTTSLTVSSEESESTAEVELVPITGNISVNTESTSYTTGNSIVISGSIQNLAEVEQHVVIIIVSPDGNFITIDQVSHDSSGNYSTTVTAGGTMNSSGEYEVRAQYGVNQITSTFDFTRN